MECNSPSRSSSHRQYQKVCPMLSSKHWWCLRHSDNNFAIISKCVRDKWVHTIDRSSLDAFEIIFAITTAIHNPPPHNLNLPSTSLPISCSIINMRRCMSKDRNTYLPHPCFLKSFIFVVAMVLPKIRNPPIPVTSAPALSSMKNVKLLTRWNLT